MSLIKPVSYPDRGFARISNLASFCTDAISRFCQGALRNVYELEQSGNELWLRNKERRSGNYSNYAEEIAVVDIDTNRDAEWIDKVDNYYNNHADKLANIERALNLVKSAKEKPLKNQIYQNSLALLFIGSNDREWFLNKEYFPWFFELFPSGLILALKFNSEYETRIAPLRWGNIGTIYDSKEKAELDKMGFDGVLTADEIHNVGSMSPTTYFTALSNFFFPYEDSYVVGRIGYMFILLTNKTTILERGPYPDSSAQLRKGYGLMQGDRPDFSNSHSAREGWRGRYVPPRCFSARELLELYRHFIVKFNHSIRLRLDLTNYRNGVDIDFIAAFEEYCTFERITLELTRCQASEDGFSARTLSFAILDKFSEITNISRINGGPEMFQYFVTQPFKNNFLLSKLQSLPAPFDTFFRAECDRIYDILYQTVLGKDGLWMNYRRTAKGIRTRKWDKDSSSFRDNPDVCSEDEFVGEIVRAVRNTHHGYVSDEDKKRRFAVFGSMHTGKLPDEFTAIPQLIWLATIEDPENTILTNCFTDKMLQSVDL